MFRATLCLAAAMLLTVPASTAFARGIGGNGHSTPSSQTSTPSHQQTAAKKSGGNATTPKVFLKYEFKLVAVKNMS